MTTTAIIIGGGLAGLTAAAYLAEAGIQPLILEANQSWLGGRLAEGESTEFDHNGKTYTFPSEHGIHGLWGGYVNMRAMLNHFVADPSLAPQPSTGEVWINRWGEKVWSVEVGQVVRSWILPAPFHYLNLLLYPKFWGAITPLDFLSGGGLAFSVLWTIGFDPLKEKSALDGFTMDDYFRLWTPNFRSTIEGVARNMLAAPDEAITASGLIAALRFYTMLRRDDWHPHFFPANSGTCVIDPLENAVVSRGGIIMHGQTVRQLQRDNGQWRVIFESASGHRQSIAADYVVMAVHAGAAKNILTQSDDTANEANDLRFPDQLRNTIVRLWFDRDADDKAPSGMFTGDFTPDNYFWLHRIHREFDEWAKSGGSAIELHFYGDRDLLNLPDRNFLATAINEVNRAFPELKGHFVHGTVRRNSQVHTAFRVMTDDMLHVTTPWENLFACGDWIGYDTPSLWMERAVTTGIAAANGILTQENLPTTEILYPRKPEPLVRVLSAGVHGIRAAFRPFIRFARERRKNQRRRST